jgi:hypothetical protein
MVMFGLFRTLDIPSAATQQRATTTAATTTTPILRRLGSNSQNDSSNEVAGRATTASTADIPSNLRRKIRAPQPAIGKCRAGQKWRKTSSSDGTIIKKLSPCDNVGPKSCIFIRMIFQTDAKNNKSIDENCLRSLVVEGTIGAFFEVEQPIYFQRFILVPDTIASVPTTLSRLLLSSWIQRSHCSFRSEACSLRNLRGNQKQQLAARNIEENMIPRQNELKLTDQKQVSWLTIHVGSEWRGVARRKLDDDMQPAHHGQWTTAHE